MYVIHRSECQPPIWTLTDSAGSEENKSAHAQAVRTRQSRRLVLRVCGSGISAHCECESAPILCLATFLPDFPFLLASCHLCQSRQSRIPSQKDMSSPGVIDTLNSVCSLYRSPSDQHILTRLHGGGRLLTWSFPMSLTGEEMITVNHCHGDKPFRRPGSRSAKDSQTRLSQTRPGTSALSTAPCL